MGSITPQPAEEYPPAVSLARDVYRPFPQVVPASAPNADRLPDLLSAALDALGGALRAGDEALAAACFLSSQAYWRDILALTWHLRTLRDAPGIAPALLELSRRRGWDGTAALDRASAREVVLGPGPGALRWVEGLFSFETESPAARCGGRVVLVPEEKEEGGGAVWKIWILSTWVDDLKAFPEDVAGLKAPGRNLEAEETIETDVFILGAGNAGLIIAARLKALGVESVLVDRNARPGDNWALRYDCLRFHVGRHSCDTPYLPYPSDLPVVLERDHLAEHMRNYAAAFHLNVLGSSAVEACSFRRATRTWTLRVRTPSGTKVVRARHLVQCTSVGGSKPYMPSLPGAEAYKGVSIHSAEYKNPGTLSAKGAKSVIIVGSANSAFDVMEDCANGGLSTSIVARSPTLIFPWEYALAPQGLGLYARVGAGAADKLQMSGPLAVGGQLVIGMYQMLAEKEPDRYAPLAATGFPVYDSRGGRGDLMTHLLERGGGHFNDIGEGIARIVDGTVKVVAGVEPVAFTETGLRFSDGRVVDTDAVVWCTGFRDKDRAVTAEVLGGKKFVLEGEDVDGEGDEVLGPQDVAARRDAIWGLDREGELRGSFKRHLGVDNYWVHGGTTAHHRYYSWPLALQIKADLEGILPKPYRDAP